MDFRLWLKALTDHFYVSYTSLSNKGTLSSWGKTGFSAVSKVTSDGINVINQAYVVHVCFMLHEMHSGVRRTKFTSGNIVFLSLRSYYVIACECERYIFVVNRLLVSTLKEFESEWCTKR